MTSWVFVVHWLKCFYIIWKPLPDLENTREFIYSDVDNLCIRPRVAFELTIEEYVRFRVPVLECITSYAQTSVHLIGRQH